MLDVHAEGSRQLDAAGRRKAIAGGVLGNLVEFHDFAIVTLVLAVTLFRRFPRYE